ncbi:MAG: hypothetical protein ABGZ24_27965 [Fuerstiella sp.]
MKRHTQGKRVLVCAITSADFSAVEVEFQGKVPRIVRQFRIPGEEFDTAAGLPGSEKLVTTLKQHDIRATTCIALLCHSEVWQQKEQIPSLSQEELHSAALLYADSAIPNGADSVVVDYVECSGQSGGNSQLCIYAVKKERVTDIQELLSDAGLQCTAITTDIVALGSGLCHKTAPNTLTTIAIPHPRSLEVLVMAGSRLLSYQNRRLCSGHDHANDQILIGEFRRCQVSLARYRQEYDSEQVIFLANTGDRQAFVQFVETETGVPPLLVNPADVGVFPDSHEPADLRLVKCVLAAVGTGRKGCLNFLSPKNGGNRRQRTVRRALLAACAGILLLACCVAWAKSHTWAQRSRLAQLHAHKETLETSLLRYSKSERLAQLLKDRQRNSPDWVDMLNRLRECVPDNTQCYFEEMTCFAATDGESPARITARVRSQDASTLLNMQQAILSSGTLSVVSQGWDLTGGQQRYSVEGNLDISNDRPVGDELNEGSVKDGDTTL